MADVLEAPPNAHGPHHDELADFSTDRRVLVLSGLAVGIGSSSVARRHIGLRSPRRETTPQSLR